MSTLVYVFLRQPPNVKYYREAHPYGPDAAGGFNNDLAVEIDPSQVAAFGKALAIVSGLARFIPDPGQPSTGTLVLRPIGLRDLSSVLGSPCSPVFVYRNLEKDSVRAQALKIIKNNVNVTDLTKKEPEAVADSFVAGNFVVSVFGGDELGRASTTGGRDGWARLGLEVVLAPGGLGFRGTGTADATDGWARLRELIDPLDLNRPSTRRLDPRALYAAVVLGAGSATLSTGDIGHAVFSVTTLRTLIEVRDEYDRPYADPIIINASDASTINAPPAPGARGTFVLKEIPPGGAAQSVNYDVAVPSRVVNLLPSGNTSSSTWTTRLTAPAHLALQAIFTDDDDNPANWFVANTDPLPRRTPNNKVTPIRDGVKHLDREREGLFRQYVEAMSFVRFSGDFVYLAGWELNDKFQLIERDPLSTVEELLKSIAHDGIDVQIRALLWKDIHGAFGEPAENKNRFPVARINGLSKGTGIAILDDETLNFGTHHQKFLVVNTRAGAIGFCGGLDIAEDRSDSPNHGAKGAFHDVHARVEGPAVNDIYQSFIDRWNDHPERIGPPLTVSPGLRPGATGSVYVQVARTYAPKKAYPFALKGSLTPLNALIRAIEKAKKFIYIEDQYLTPYPGDDLDDWETKDTVGVLKALTDALTRIDYLLILIPNYSDQPQSRFRRRIFIEGLLKASPEKVHVFYLKRTTHTKIAGEVATLGGCDTCSGGSLPLRREEIYIHSKVWIVDDIIAKIGSANCNRRSYTHDSEMDLIMVDGALDNGARAFARKFRKDLWAEHLGMPGFAALLEDHLHALTYWLNPRLPAHPRVAAYEHTSDAELPGLPRLPWDFIDPDGTK